MAPFLATKHTVGRYILATPRQLSLAFKKTSLTGGRMLAMDIWPTRMCLAEANLYLCYAAKLLPIYIQRDDGKCWGVVGTG